MPDEQVRYNVPFAQVPNELIKDERTTVYHIGVFAALAAFANTDKRAWPSQNRLSKLTGVSRNKLKQTLEELKSFGWLTIKRRWNEEENRYSSTLYVLSPSLQGWSPRDQGVGHHVTKGWSPDAQEQEPLNNNHLNKSPTVEPPVPMKDPLDRAIDESFRSVHLYENFGRERGQIRQISARCRRRDPDDPEKAAKEMLGAFKWLREHDPWFRDQPFVPSMLVSQWDRVAARIETAKANRDLFVDAEFFAGG